MAAFRFLLSFVAAAGLASASVRAPAARGGPLTVLRGEVRWAARTTHVLSGPTVVAPGSTLIIEPGARIEASAGASLIVPRDARIDARGTILEPVVFTCRLAMQVPGCWGGIVIAGNSPVNHGTPTSPPPRGSGAAGCNEAADQGVMYGGCPFADSSGVLQYVRVEYSVGGLRLLGVGSATVIEYVQVHRALGDGLSVVGGTVGMKHIALTASGQYGLHWLGGWTGRAQHLIVQADPSLTAGGVLGQNGGLAVDDALPRSAPSIANLTVVLRSSPANPYASTPPRALVLERGTAGDLRDVVLFQPAVALDVDGTATCAQLAGGALRLRGVLTAGATALAPPGAPQSSCGPYAGPVPEAQWLADAVDRNVVVTDPAVIATVMLAPLDIILPDLRPRYDSPAGLLGVVGGGGAFFDVATWRGGVAPAEPARNNIPWYSGWTIGEVLSAPATASLSGTVWSVIRGPLTGVLVTVEPSLKSAPSGVGGAYAIGLIPPGPVTLRLSNIPAGCMAPPPEAVTLDPGGLATRDIGVPCRPPISASLDAGARHTCALTAAGEAWCWGSNDRGQLGVGGIGESRVPTRVAGTAVYQAIAASNVHSCGLTSAGAVLCWGGNSAGQLGMLDTLDRNLPTPLTSSAGVNVAAGGARLASLLAPMTYSAVAAGAEHTCALAATGRAYCWGQNSAGQLGIGNTLRTQGPAEVSGATVFAGVTAGGTHSCAWTAAGVAHCWGSNATGALGIAAPQALVPTPVNTALRFTSLSAGESYTCGITTATQAVCWGTNVVGQVGVGRVGNEPFPVVISGNPITASIGAAAEASILSHTCAVTSAGAGLCWGHNSTFQLGTETTTNCTYAVFTVPCSLAPLPVDGGLAFTRIVAGAAHSCGFTASRELWCWGDNAAGQLGNGGSGTSILPVKVAGLLDFP